MYALSQVFTKQVTQYYIRICRGTVEVMNIHMKSLIFTYKTNRTFRAMSAVSGAYDYSYTSTHPFIRTKSSNMYSASLVLGYDNRRLQTNKTQPRRVLPW